MRLLYQLTGQGSQAYLRRLSELLEPLARPDVELVVRNIPDGPTSLEYGFQAAAVMPKLVQAVQAADAEFDGVVLGCFLDPGIHIAREVASIPVIGLGQASLQVAATLGHRIGILAGLKRLVPAIEQMVHGYGYDYSVGAVAATDLTVSNMRLDAKGASDCVRSVIDRMVEERGVDVIVGGCGSLGEIFAELRPTSRIPLIDARVAALKHLEMLADLYRLGHAGTSKVGLYERPPALVG